MFTFGRNLCLYLVAGLFWSLGLMTFFLTYNLYLLDLGFHEAFIGRVMASMTLGSLCVALPSALIIRCFGLRRTIQTACLGTVLSLLARSMFSGPSWLTFGSFASGITIGMWIVAAPPFLAQNTVPSNRSRAFSLSYGGSIGMGTLAGVLVGYLPRWTAILLREQTTQLVQDHRIVLGWGVLFIVVAFMILLAIHRIHDTESPLPPPTPFLERLGLRFPRFSPLALFHNKFLGKLVLVVLLWNLFTGSFSPFFNVFFSHRYQKSLSEIGLIFSASQFFQMAAVFCMPYLVSQIGAVRALSSMQLAAALTLPLLAFASHSQTAAILYLLYISLQVMGEPALETFIMNSVPANERSLTSAVRYTVHFLVQAFAAGITGQFLEQLGYSIPFFVVSATGVLAATSFYLCFRSSIAEGSTTVVQHGL